MVLLADLNATPATPEVRVLTDRLADAGAGCTFPNPIPYRRIDYVMVGGGRPGSAAVIGSIRARFASDHLPVVAELVPAPQ